MSLNPPIDLFAPSNVVNGSARPATAPNAWVADWADRTPTLTLSWDEAQTIASIVLGFDTDFDHPMESVLMGHPEREMPFCVKRYRILNANGAVIHECTDNHQFRNTVRLPQPVASKSVHVEIIETHGWVPSVFEIRCYGPATIS
jgi:hypothetical protein